MGLPLDGPEQDGLILRDSSTRIGRRSELEWPGRHPGMSGISVLSGPSLDRDPRR